MSEKPIMWIGKQPGQKKPMANPEKDAALAAELTAVCEAAGYAVDGFLAAHGNYGSWLVRISDAGKQYQLIWDGKAGQLRHHAAIAGGGWDELACCGVESKETAGFVRGAEQLLADNKPG
jgi:hypothetical protein